jgi:hypothetical protein
MFTPKRNMSTEGETLQVSVLPYRCSICPPLVTYQAPDKRFSHTLDSLGRWPRPACSFRSAQAATLLEFHVQLTNCFVRRWFCLVHGPKPPLHRQNWLSFGKFQDTERFLIPCPRHVSSRLPPSAETCKYATVSSTQKNLGEVLYLLICSFLLCLSWLLRSRFRNFPDGLMNYPVFDNWGKRLGHKKMYNYSQKMFTRRAKPTRITSVRISGIILYFCLKQVYFR